jgi:nucleolar GTP-binding protein
MYRIPTILNAQEILDKAFKKAEKIPYKGKKEDSEARINSFSDTVSSTLRRYVGRFPSFDNMHPFYRELLDISVGVDELRKALSRVQWASEKVQEIAKEEKKRMDEDNHWAIRKRVYGRISSVVKKTDKDLEILRKARDVMKELPELREDAVTIVMAGHPNVGKSSVIRYLSTAEPEIASYPFTTKKIIVGHRIKGDEVYQFIDTPGLLDRAPEERNDIERTAIAALKYATDIMVFLLDPTETCGYPMEKQEELMDMILDEFDVPYIVVETKSDIMKRNTENIKVSAVTGEGMDVLMGRLREISGTLHTPERS